MSVIQMIQKQLKLMQRMPPSILSMEMKMMATFRDFLHSIFFFLAFFKRFGILFVEISSGTLEMLKSDNAALSPFRAGSCLTLFALGFSKPDDSFNAFF